MIARRKELKKQHSTHIQIIGRKLRVALKWNWKDLFLGASATQCKLLAQLIFSFFSTSVWNWLVCRVVKYGSLFVVSLFQDLYRCTKIACKYVHARSKSYDNKKTTDMATPNSIKLEMGTVSAHGLEKQKSWWVWKQKSIQHFICSWCVIVMWPVS